jgi:DNA primase
MGLFPQSFIDDVRMQANIATVIQDACRQPAGGGRYKALPLSFEKTPSFSVDPAKGFFHCFGCKVGGDVFKFLELHERVGFQDAVRLLAQKFGLSIPETEEGDEARHDARLRESLLKIHETAALYFREQLASAAGQRRGSS